jgi:hypothetical protein
MGRMARLSTRHTLTGFLGRRLGVGCWRTRRARFGQVAVLELARQIDDETSLLLQRGFQLGEPNFEFADPSIPNAAALAKGTGHSAMAGISSGRSCAELPKMR